MAYRNGPIILQEYGPEGFGFWTGNEDSLTGSQTGSETGSETRIQTVKLKIPGKLFFKVGCRISVTFKL